MLRKIVTKNTVLILISLLLCSSSGNAHNKTFGQAEEINKLIAELYNHAWNEPEIVAVSPTIWNLGLTEPMEKILKIGSAAQEPLLEKISDPRIKDQVIMLLGGVGDEQAVEPIIHAMIPPKDFGETPKAWQINLSASLALTNITVADVIWHHGGGPLFRPQIERSKELWLSWWKKNSATFTVRGITQSRNYSNYPNYGIYSNGSGKILQQKPQHF